MYSYKRKWQNKKWPDDSNEQVYLCCQSGLLLLLPSVCCFESFRFEFSLDKRVTTDTVKLEEMQEETQKGRLMKVQKAQTCCLLCPIWVSAHWCSLHDWMGGGWWISRENKREKQDQTLWQKAWRFWRDKKRLQVLPSHRGANIQFTRMIRFNSMSALLTVFVA